MHLEQTQRFLTGTVVTTWLPPELPSNMKDDSTTKHASAFPFPNEFTLLMLPLQMRSIPPFLFKQGQHISRVRDLQNDLA